VGYVLDPRVFMGPVISDGSLTRIEAALRSARDGGYTAVVPSARVEIAGRAGHYLAPSVHVAAEAATHAPGYSDEELFGPDLAVHVVDDLLEGVARANASRYGLAAAVFTARRERFEAAAAELDVGVVHWNRSTAGATGRLPFGGVKQSGNHRPGGLFMGQACVYPQARYLAPEAGAPLPRWPGLFDE
jgi:acyl-CoA reductase-like NAD-dependent aldehyde dehydrogenase